MYCPHWLAATLDEIDYGLLLLDDGQRVAHINHAAHAELDDDAHPLQLCGATLQARRPQDAAPLHDAIAAARQRGLRRLIAIGEGARCTSIAIVPLAAPDPGHHAATLLMFGKRTVCETLSVQCFARCHGLTVAETRVLVELCRGTPPCEIANELGVAISTVRTQIGNVRLKTGAQSIRALVRQVAVLPPLMGVLGRRSALPA
ncbi:MAG TPA: LuxR C-terminal-related transcriptional regulator [Burkholderiaceae bacterium]|nr:LuxR C-terminal-related transcriptional regulator [Burkholderiaceae bacterium]